MRNLVLAAAILTLAIRVAPLHAQEIYASPHPTYSPQPNYSDSQGVVAVQLHVDATGIVTEARAISGPAPLQESAIQTAKTWKFEPTLISGKATPVITTVNMTFGTPSPAPAPAPALPTVISSTIPVPPPPNGAAAAARLGSVATTDGDRVIGSLKWEIREEATGKILGSGDGPVHLKDVHLLETPNPSRRQTPKTIQLTNEFYLEMAEFPAGSITEKSGFGITGRRSDIASFSWEWFNVQDSKHAVKLQEGGTLGIDLQQVNGFWEVTKTEFTTDVSLRIIRMGTDPPGSPPYWRINISKGSAITWPSIFNGKISPN